MTIFHFLSYEILPISLLYNRPVLRGGEVNHAFGVYEVQHADLIPVTGFIVELLIKEAIVFCVNSHCTSSWINL